MRGQTPPDAPIEHIRRHLVALRMPRALETLGHLVQQIERGQIGTIEAIEMLLAEELTVRESRRIKAALQMARLGTIKTLSGFDFAFQPSLDRNRILALAQLDFIDRHEVVHLIGQSGTGKSHLAVALGVEAVRAGRSVYFSPLADIIDNLARADREGRLRERIRYLCRAQLLIIDEIGYLSVGAGAGNLFFQVSVWSWTCSGAGGIRRWCWFLEAPSVAPEGGEFVGRGYPGTGRASAYLDGAGEGGAAG
jgi:DNA replication protein DnaC